MTDVHRQKSEFVKYTVHYPVGGCRTDAVAGTDSFSLQVFYYGFYERKLYMRGIFGKKLLAASFSMQGDGIVSENRETDHSLVSDDFYTVFLGRFMGNETP